MSEFSKFKSTPSSSPIDVKDAVARRQLQSTQTTSGNPITLTDCAPINAESLVVELEPIQEGSGDPSPTNIRPITGYTECNVDDVGFNQWDEEWEIGDIDANTGAKKTGNYFISKNYIQVLSGNYYIMFGNSNVYGFIYKYNKDKQYLGYINRVANQVFEIPQDTSYILFLVASYSTTYNHDICINISKTEGTPKNGDYVPYRSSNATIQFGQTVYGGKVDFLTGVLTVDMGNYSITEDTSISRNNDYSFYFYVTGIKAGGSVICDRLESSNAQNKYDTFVHPTLGAIRVNTADPFSTGDALRDFLLGAQFVFDIAEPFTIQLTPQELQLLKQYNNITTNGTTINLGYQPDNVIGEVKGEIEAITEMDYLRILDNNVDTPINNYRIYYHFISSAYTLVNMAEMLQHRFIFVEVIQNPSGTSNHNLLHSALVDPRTIDGFEYIMKASGNDNIWIELILDENKFNLSLRTTGGSYSDGDPTDYYVTIRLVY